MEPLKTEITYRRRGQTGVLTLKGTVDIFEAATLHAMALKAVNDDKASHIQVNLEQSERLDTAVLQILANLSRTIQNSQRNFELAATPNGIAAAISTLSLQL